ncbi:MAG: glycosyltransferase family 4 protein, partial [Desulfobacterales bacterium]|nr:glycosyltransferase family 4 protein [Desulfobacterales bacterium]
VLYQQATGLADEDISVFAITRHAGLPLRVISDINGVSVGSYSASAQNMLRSLFPVVRYPVNFYRRFTQDAPFQTAICHQPFNCFSLLITRKLGHLPFLYVFHSPSHEEYLLSYPNSNRFMVFLNVNFRRMIEKFCLKRAMKIMVLSRYMKEKVQDIHGITADRIQINPGGVDLNRFRPPEDRKFLKHKLGFPEGRIHLLTVRNLEPRMGIENLLKSIRILKRGPDEIHLILGGEGIEMRNLKRLIKEYGLLNDVTMAGFIPPDILSEYYGAADFFVLPTRSLEGFGLVTPESMACGTPVLGTPVGGTREILSGFDSRFLFRDTSPESMSEGIRRAVGEYFVRKKQYKQLRLDCHEYAAKNYSWERHTDQLRAMLDNEMHLLPIN